jgi:hypothetical protein
VGFELDWDTTPPGIVDTLQRWTLPAKYVNQSYQYSDSCASYRLNNDLLTNNPTLCWYVNLPGGRVSMWQNLHFSNGQYVSVAAEGDFTIYRPTAEVTYISSPQYYTLTETNLLYSKLQLGASDGTGDLSYTVQVQSKRAFTGNCNITQLITADYSYIGFQFSDERADGGAFYNETPARVIRTGSTGLSDGPWERWVQPNLVSLSARDFVRFLPDGTGSIWVTLGITRWETVGIAEQDIWTNWSITEDATTGPDALDTSDEFPIWLETVTTH